jgi:hypothetical protein
MSTHWIGDTVEKEAVFRDTDGGLANPDTVLGNAKKPSGASVAASLIVNPSLGVFDVLYDADQSGIWYFRIKGEGNGVNAVVEGSFCVRESSVI